MKIIVYGKTSASLSAPGPSLGVPTFLSPSSPLLLQPPEVDREREVGARIQAKKSRAATLNISWFPFVLEAPWRGPRRSTEPRGFGPVPHRGGRDLEGPGGASSGRVGSCPPSWLKPSRTACPWGVQAGVDEGPVQRDKQHTAIQNLRSTIYPGPMEPSVPNCLPQSSVPAASDCCRAMDPCLPSPQPVQGE